MSFNPDAKLDPGQIQDRRGGGRGGGIAVGGGLGTLIVLAIYLLTNGQVSIPPPSGGAGSGANPSSDINATCTTGQVANQRDDCRIVGYVNSIQKYWSDEFAGGPELRAAQTVLFTGADQHRLRHGDRATSGPFYCPADKHVYLDLGFFDELQQPVRRPGRAVRRRPTWSPTSTATTSRTCSGIARVERRRGARAPTGQLGADRAAGRLLRRRLGEPRGRDRLPRTADRRRTSPTALDAAAAVGDDRIQKRDAGPGEPRDLDARLVRAAPALVQDRLPVAATRTPATRAPSGADAAEPTRCGWAGIAHPEYTAYHDVEWGVPLHDDRALFELLCLEGAQAGLSWLTILRRRDGYRAAFDNFDPVRVAAYTDVDRARLLADRRIVRNRAKVDACIGNARALPGLPPTALPAPSMRGCGGSSTAGPSRIAGGRWTRCRPRHRSREGCRTSCDGPALASSGRRSATPSCSRRASSTTTWSPASVMRRWGGSTG